MDGGFVDLEDIRALEVRGVRVYAPPKRREGAKDVSWKPGTTPEVLAWRERMETEEGKATYKHRASTAECVNAQGRGRHGAQRLKVRGVTKVTDNLLLLAITHNLMRWAALTG